VPVDVKGMRSKVEIRSGELLNGPAFDVSFLERNEFSMENDESLLQHRSMEEWVVKYEVNEKGVGRILLPPSLSILLQSDRVCIQPHAGGLYIRSVYKTLE
jgi:hypothetical protein